MKQVVDASAVLAYLLDEPGGTALTTDDGPFYLSAVNLAEILTRAIDRGLAIDEVMLVLKRLPIEHVHFAREGATRAAMLRAVTRSYGLSLGDRACLALAEKLALPVLTADSAWAELEVGLDIHLIR